MKKKLLFTCLIGLISVTSAYAACDGGTMVGSFCKSDVGMNWWSAVAWCKANGMQLASMYEMCPSWDGNIDVTCSELKGKGEGYVWSATASGSTRAYNVYLPTGNVHINNYGGRTETRATAFCK